MDCILNANIIKYADGTVLFFSGKSLQIIEQNQDIDRLSVWFEENELITNLKIGKSEVMLFGTPQKRSKLKKETLNINYRSSAINVTTEYKYLGVHIDSTLNLNTHFDKVYKKASGKLNLLAKLRYQLDTISAVAIYDSMIVPTITYCSSLQANLTSTRKKCLQSFVNRASKITAHNSNISAKLSSMESITNRHLYNFVRKCLDNETCEQFENYYELLQHRLVTINNNTLLRLPKVRTKYGKRSVFFTGAKVYNELPI